MSSSLRQFHDDLQREASRRLDGELAKGLLLEAQAHLDAEVQARMELGATREEAEAEAVAAFGSPKAIARRMAEVEEPTRRLHKPTMYWATALIAWMGLWTLTGWEPAIRPLLYVSPALFAGFCWASFQSRRWRPIPLFGICFAASLAFALAISVTWLNLYLVGGMGYVPGWQVAGLLAQQAALRPNREDVSRLIQLSLKAFDPQRPNPLALLQVARPEGFRVLDQPYYSEWSKPIGTHYVATWQEANEAWAIVRSGPMQSSVSDWLTRADDFPLSVREARHVPFWQAFPPALPESLQAGGTIFCVLAISNLCFACLGAVVSRRRKRRQALGD